MLTKSFPFLADHFAIGDVFLQVVLDASPDDLPKPKMILFDIKNHKVSCLCSLTPLRRRGRRCLPRNSERRWRTHRNTHSF
jgi:hypothetical protein